MSDTHSIGDLETVNIRDLNTHYRNPRRGDVAVIKQSMRANGVYNPMVVNRGTFTGRKMEVIAGNHRLLALRELADEHPDDPAWTRADVYVVDVDEDRATRILLADNRTSDLGGYDNDELLGLLDDLDGDYIGTGYTDDYVDALLGANTPDDWLDGEDDAEIENAQHNYSIVVDCRSEQEQVQLLEKFMEEGLECRAIM